MQPIRVPENFRIIAHRGASAYAPENTMAAFELAAELGATEVELDVQLSTDGVPMICHDSTLARYGHGGRRVEEMDSKELLSLDMGSWLSPRFKGERMLTLAGLLKRFGPSFTYHIEIKGKAPGLASKTLEAVRSEKLSSFCFFTSFSREWLVEMISLAPDARCGWLVEGLSAETIATADEMGLFQLCPKAAQIDRESVRRAHEVCEEVRLWGMPGDAGSLAEPVRLALECKCDGATVNGPDWLVHA